MTVTIESGFDTNVVGTFQLVADTGAGNVTVTLPLGRYCHTSLVSVMGAGEYAALADELQNALNASALGGTWDVDYDPGPVYTITCTGTTGTISGLGADHGTASVARLGLAMGFTTSPGAFTDGETKTGDVRPYYVINGAVGGISNVSGDYEPDGITEDAEAEDGTSYSVSRTTAPKYSDAQIPFEPHEATHAWKATAAVPWTWEHFHQHARGTEPFRILTDVDDSVHKLRAGSTSFRPARVKPDWDDLWSVELKTRLLGRI